MSSIWGENVKISVFGESHGTAIGVVMDGFPPGIALDIEKISFEMDRRRPGRDAYSTQRKEGDAVEIVSGLYQGYTTGTPLCGIIRNTDKRSKDYEAMKDIMRPGHADYTGRIRYQGFADYRGGGHFSGRLTAPIVFAGAIAQQYLERKGIVIGTHVLQIGKVEDTSLDASNIPMEQLRQFRKMRFPVLSEPIAQRMKEEIDAARMQQDSVGGLLETAIVNLPAGLGSPLFHSVESRLAAIIFSIPAIKGLEFGSGFGFASMHGSEANDPFTVDENNVKTTTNHAGGINGGITNGMPVLFRMAIRPTPSIAKPQQALNMDVMQSEVFSIRGRHDPCIAIRAVPVIDAAAALVIMDLILDAKKYKATDELIGE